MRLYKLIISAGFCACFLMQGHSQTWNNFTTNDGYIDLGPANPDWAHIYSNKPFIFNQNIYAYHGIFASYQSTPMQFVVNYSPRMTINAGGNIAIGAPSSPQNETRLFVQTASDSAGQVGIYAKSHYTPDWGYGIISAFPKEEFKAFAAINYLTDEEVFVVNGDGHVYATEITVTQTPFPDYVFEVGYKLPTIDSLSNFISVNKHLPNIPSAKEVENNGIGVGELQRLQMEKIEELTLYIIQLNNRVNSLDKTLKKLENK